MRRTSEAGLKLIKRFEGLSLEPYLDAAGRWTVGYGHLLRQRETRRPITPAEAEILLHRDVERAERDVERLVARALTQGEFDALVSFVFNLGAGRFAASRLRQKMNDSDPFGAAAEFLRWHYAGKKPLKGLLRRRLAEAALYLSE